MAAGLASGGVDAHDRAQQLAERDTGQGHCPRGRLPYGQSSAGDLSVLVPLSHVTFTVVVITKTHS